MKKVKIAAVMIAAFSVISVAAIKFFSTKTVAETERSASDIQLLARCVNGEARGEIYEGQVAVAAVILNRVRHPSFPNTISGVIYQPGAFTAVADGQINEPAVPFRQRVLHIRNGVVVQPTMHIAFHFCHNVSDISPAIPFCEFP